MQHSLFAASCGEEQDYLAAKDSRAAAQRPMGV